MIFELFLKPVTGTKKLIDKMYQNLLIGLSIAIPLLISLIPAFVIKQLVASILKPLESIGGLFGDSIGKGTSSITTSVDTYIFKYVFGRILILIIIITILLFGVLVIYYNVKKIAISPKKVWQAMMVSGIQVVYYFIIGGLLSFLSLYFAVICLIGIINSIICLHYSLDEYMFSEKSLLNNLEIDKVGLEKSAGIQDAEVTSSEIAAATETINVPVLFTSEDNTQPALSIPITERIVKLTSKQKLAGISLFSIIVVVIILIFVGNSFTSKTYVSQKLEQAIKNNDTKEMSKYLIASDPRLKVDQESLKGYSDFLKDNPSYTSDLLKAIQTEIDDAVGSTSLIKLTTSGKKYLFFNNYVYQLPACFIRVQTQYKNTEVLLNGKQVYTSDSDNQLKECGPYLPGKYNLDADLKTSYAEVKGHQDIVLDPQNISSNILETTLNLNGQSLNLFSDYKDAKILINGKDSGITVKDVNKLIPLPNDGSYSVQLENEFPWGSMKSNQQVFGKDDMEFSFDKGNTALVDAINPVILNFIKSYVAAYTTFDPSKITNCSDKYKQDITNDINDKKSFGQSFSGSLSSVMVDPQSLHLDYSNDNGTTYTLNINGSFNGDLAFGGNQYLDSNSYNIGFVYDSTQKKWLVDSFNGNWFSDKVTTGTEIKLN